MKWFKRRKWKQAANEFMIANMVNGFGDRSVIDVKVVLQVKEKKDGTHIYKCFSVKAVSGEFVQNVNLDYMLNEFKEENHSFRIAVKKYNLRP